MSKKGPGNTTKTRRGSSKAPPVNAWVPGQSGNPAGRPKLPPDLKEALAADSLDLYEKAKKMLDLAMIAGDLTTASRLVLGLLKKTIPDSTTLLVGGTDGGPLRVQRIDPKTLTTEQVDALIALQKAQQGG